jgi:hypothetical protein
MANEENFVTYTAEELASMRARGEGMTGWAWVDAKTDAEIAADTASDSAWIGIPENWMDNALPGFGPMFPPQDDKIADHEPVAAEGGKKQK